MSAPSSQLTKEESVTLRKNVIQASIDNERYLRSHPEIHAVLQHVLSEALLSQPDEPVTFIENFLATNDLHAVYKKLQQEAEH